MAMLATIDPPGVFSVILVGVAVLVVAAYLIAIVLILQHVSNQLVVILGAIWGISEKTRGIGPVIEGVNSELQAGQRALEEAVRRLEERTGQGVR